MLRKITYFSKSLRAEVSTWSPLAMAFNSPPNKRLNLIQNEVGLFNLPELKVHDGFYLLKESAILKTDKLIAEATSQIRTRKIVEIFDELSDSLCKVADLAEFIRLAHPKVIFSQAAEDACISISRVVEKLNTHKNLYQALKNVVDTGDVFETNVVDDHVAKLFLFDFEQCGIHLEETQRKKVVRLNDSILQIGQRFMTGAVNPRSISKSSLASNIQKLYA